MILSEKLSEMSGLARWVSSMMHARNRSKSVRSMCVGFPVYVMPVGARKEQQEDSNVVGKIANRAIQQGYHVSGRLHAVLWGNGIGT